MSKHSVLLFFFFAAAFAAPQNQAQFQSGNVFISFDESFHRQIRWLADRGRGIVAFDRDTQESVEVNGWTITAFRLQKALVTQRRVQDAEFGPALEGVLVGIFRDPSKQLHVERRMRILLPDRFPDVAIFQNWYKNLGTQPVRLGKVYSQRLLVDRSLAEPEADPYALASFQGGAYHWGRDYALIWLKPYFQQLNFQGLEDPKGPEGEGGGMPFIDIWGPIMGVALAHLEKLPQFVYLPVEVRLDRRVEMGIWEQPLAKFKQAEWLKPGETFQTVVTAVIFHRGDFYDALSNYGQLLRSRGVAIPTVSPPSAYKPYWKSWGFGLDFRVDKILALLPELKSMGIEIANLDDGWFDYYGDWQVNRSPGKFPEGDRDMRNFVRKVHTAGFKTNLWWYPLGVSPESRLAKEHPELLVQSETGVYPQDERKLYQLCPAYEPARQHIASLLRKFILDYDYDGVYVDTVGLSAVPPCFNPAHHHRSPLDSFQAMPLIYKLIRDELRKMKPDPYYEVCICSMPHSPYYMPYYDIANASDPVNVFQMRRRIKVEKAIRGPRFCVGDCYQVPIDQWKGSSVPESFESAMGTGAQMTTFYSHLSATQLAKWRHWFRLYNELQLSSAEFLNLYDIAFDKPEAYVVRKGKQMFYGFFADYWPVSRPIPLRGLDPKTTYELVDYANDRPLGKVIGGTATLKIGFKDSLLVVATPAP